MTLFIFACALLSIFVLLWVGRPLWQSRHADDNAVRSLRQTNIEALEAQLVEAQQEYAAGRLDADTFAETERELAIRLVEEGEVKDAVAKTSAAQPILFGSIALLVVALTAGLYLDVGKPNLLQEREAIALKDNQSNELTEVQAEQRVQELRVQLEKEARDLPAWVELARLERRLGDTAAASRSYQHATMLADNDALLTDLQLEMIETLALHAEQQGGGIPPIAHQIIKEVLARHTEHPRALWYGSMLAEGTGDRKLAIQYINKLLSLNPPEQIKTALQQQLAAWNTEPGAPAGQPVTSGREQAEEQPQASSRVISVNVAIPNGVDVGNTNAATLFVYARPADGPRMPLAVWREESPVFPLQATLDDSMAMMPGTQLAGYEKLELVARISFTGNAISAPGDWFGSVVVGQEQNEFSIAIDQLIE